jgi:putative chitinase
MITLEQFKQLCPRAKSPEKIVAAFNEYAPKFGIDTPKRAAMFLAQCSHECAGFTVFEENLNYSQKGLRSTWASRFPTDAIAYRYARQPRAIANFVYAGRYGNGNEKSGDGWSYRGRGCKQLTFKDNYARFEKDTGIPVLKNPDILMQFPEALISGMWYWMKGNPTGKSLNPYADAGDVKGCTKLINGGYIGLKERTDLFNAFSLVILNK